MQVQGDCGDVYWIASDEPPWTWGAAELVAPWFIGALRMDRSAWSQLRTPPASEIDDEHELAAWLSAQLESGGLRIWRRARRAAATHPIERRSQPPPLLSELSVTELTWIGWEVLDPHGRPVPGIAYELSTPDGDIRTGVTDDQGRVHESAIATGTCAIRFMPTAA